MYHRILRFTNYLVAMVNKSLLPLKYKIPILGDHAFLSTGLKFNLELILFKSPWVSFDLLMCINLSNGNDLCFRPLLINGI